MSDRPCEFCGQSYRACEQTPPPLRYCCGGCRMHGGHPDLSEEAA